MEVDGETTPNLTREAGGGSLALEVLLVAVLWAQRGSPAVSWCLLCHQTPRQGDGSAEPFIPSPTCLVPHPEQCHGCHS